MNNIQNIIVISLSRAIERREKMIDQLIKLKLVHNHNVMIMNAIDGNDLSDEDKNRKIYLTNGYRFGDLLKPGEIACTMSHINALKIAKDNNWESAIILEDDIILAEDFEKRIEKLITILPKKWEHVYLSGIPRIEPNISFLNIPHLVKSSFTQCTHSMLINNNSYDKIINKLSKFETTTDDMYCDLLKNDLNSYSYFPYISYANSEYSYIANTKGDINHPSKKYFKNKL